MIKDAVRGRGKDHKSASLVLVYMLAKALAISPLEIYKMPVSLVKNSLSVHFHVEELKAEELEKAQKKSR